MNKLFFLMYEALQETHHSILKFSDKKIIRNGVYVTQCFIDVNLKKKKTFFHIQIYILVFK